MMVRGADELPLTRRIVTAIDNDGLSYIADDGPSPAVITVPERPGYRNHNIWRTTGKIQDADTILDHRGVLPLTGGTIIRVIDIPPRPADSDEARRQMAAVFTKLFPDARHQSDSQRSLGMHTTDTIDYAVVMKGEIVAVMDRGEAILREGDILVQRGTNHAWENRSGRSVRMLFILCDSRR
jgi:hypothetical protein